MRLVISDAHQGLKNADGLRDRFPKLAELMDDAEQEVLALMQFPKDHWKKIASTNLLERRCHH